MEVLDLSSKRPTISQIENAFQPAREVNDPEKFAGRKDAVSQAYYGLIADGAHLAIVGNRGIGKTSLARQVINLGSGDNTLMEKLDLEHDRNLDFLPIYFTCGTTIKDVSGLLEKLLTTAGCLSDWIYYIPKASKIVSGLTPKAGGSMFGAEVSIEKKKETETTTESAMSTHSVESIFTNVVSAISSEKVAPDGILIVVDEFDQIIDPTGFASFLKALTTNVPKVKFCIVGVAQDLHNLMKEHQSSDRLFAGAIISLKSMADEDLKEIVRIAEKSIDHYIRFDEPATSRLISLAQGHPYMVHLIGKYALRSAYQQDKRVVNMETIEDSLKAIAERGLDPVLEGRYKKAVASSEHRELVLKAMAEAQAEDGEIWTGNAYKIALENGVDNPSQYVGQLVIEEYGGEIEKVRDRYYRFHDSLFATYVKARPMLVQKRLALPVTGNLALSASSDGLTLGEPNDLGGSVLPYDE